MDNGITSGDLLNGLAAGLTEAGVNVINAGEGSTGIIYESIQRLGAQGGAMITRSHVEKEYNGIKIVLGSEALHSRFIEQIRDRVFSSDVRHVQKPAACLSNLHDLLKTIYEHSLLNEFLQPMRKGSGRVAINFGGGTARLYHECLAEILGDRLVAVSGRKTTRKQKRGFPIPPSRAIWESKLPGQKTIPT